MILSLSSSLQSPANRPVGQQDEVVVPPAQMEVEVDREQPAGPNAGPNAEIGENAPEVDEQPRPVRGPGRGYINVWQDVLCNVCGQVAGQIKLDPGPANRDPETWFMRVKEGDRWASKYPKFRRRTANVIGISDDFATGWVHENRTCCDGAAP